MKHCKKHKLDYNDYLKECPICFGETLDPKISYYRKDFFTKEIKNDKKEVLKTINDLF